MVSSPTVPSNKEKWPPVCSQSSVALSRGSLYRHYPHSPRTALKLPYLEMMLNSVSVLNESIVSENNQLSL